MVAGRMGPKNGDRKNEERQEWKPGEWVRIVSIDSYYLSLVLVLAVVKVAVLLLLIPSSMY